MMARSFLLALMFVVGCVSAEVVEKLRGTKPEIVDNASDNVEADQMMQSAAEVLSEREKEFEGASEMERPEGVGATVDVVEAAMGLQVVDDVEDLFQAEILQEVVEAPDVDEEGLVSAAPVVVEDSDVGYTAAGDEETAVTNKRRLQGGYEHETSRSPVVQKSHLHVDGLGRLVRSSEHHDDGRKSVHVHETSNGRVVHNDHVHGDGVDRDVRASDHHDGRKTIGEALVELITGKERVELTRTDGRDASSLKDTASQTHSHAGGEQIVVKHVIVSNSEPSVEKTKTSDESNNETESSESSEEDSDKKSVSSESSESSSEEGQRGRHQVTVGNIPSGRSCFECDIDYYGFDVKKIENGIVSITDCQMLCQDHSMCDFFTFVESWGGCYLKHSRKGRIAETTKVLVSGLKYCNNSGSIQCHGNTVMW
eukprot:GHVS01024075.1.p1 GENE.GHVS01024075.1~~GHVS01024075.1.p1  ORF type:complete len:425 (+),score=73.93 GHVS01024075.1:164-1438(+)